MRFGPDFLEEKNIRLPLDRADLTRSGQPVWINFDSVHDTKLIQDVGHAFDLHPLILEDIMHPHQRPKAEDHGHALFVVAVMLYHDVQSGELVEEQVSFVLGDGFLLTFQEHPIDVFEPVRERLRQKTGRVHERGADYLMYALLDVIVDNYFTLLEEMGEAMDDMEDRIFIKPDNKSLIQIQENKRKLISFRRAIVPLRDAVSRAEHLEFDLIQTGTRPFLQDLSDHLQRTGDLVENYREVNNGLKDSYMSGMSLKLNNIMRVLTIISTIFIPLSFLVGVYGMNFDYMPELRWHYGYHVVWVVMVLLSLGLLWFFRKRKWL